jgi:hypothetical protein
VDGSKDGSKSVTREARLLVLSALSAFISPFVFVSIIVLRKVNRRVNVQARFWNSRLRREMARWS